MTLAPRPRRIAWLVPRLLEGSGGHRTMFQNINALVARGHTCHVYIQHDDPGSGAALRRVRQQAETYFGPTGAEIRLGFEPREPYDLALATVWYSAKFVAQLSHIPRRAYFVQDYEAMFNPVGDAYLAAENSYRLGLTPITIGRWLSHTLASEYACSCAHFDFCADTRVYRPLSDVRREHAVCFICQPEKPRRCPRLGVQTLALVKRALPHVKIYFYGSRERVDVPFAHEDLGLVSVEACNELYNRCLVGLCISSTNPSRIPFEMMAAGLPVVDVHRGNNLYDLPEGGVLLGEPRAESLAQALVSILNNDELRSHMSRFGQRFMRQRPLEHGYEQFVGAVESLLDDRFVPDPAKEPVYRAKPVRCEPGSTIAQLRDAAEKTGEAFLAEPTVMPGGEWARRELKQLESSRAWRAVEAMKRSIVYRAYASARYGAGWKEPHEDESPAARLQRIRASRSYRLIRAVKSSGAYRVLTRARGRG